MPRNCSKLSLTHGQALPTKGLQGLHNWQHQTPPVLLGQPGAPKRRGRVLGSQLTASGADLGVPSTLPVVVATRLVCPGVGFPGPQELGVVGLWWGSWHCHVLPHFPRCKEGSTGRCQGEADGQPGWEAMLGSTRLWHQLARETQPDNFKGTSRKQRGGPSRPAPPWCALLVGWEAQAPGFPLLNTALLPSSPTCQNKPVRSSFLSQLPTQCRQAIPLGDSASPTGSGALPEPPARGPGLPLHSPQGSVR